MLVKTNIKDFRDNTITFGNDYADELLQYISKEYNCKIADNFNEIWEAYNENDYNSYNSGFLGNDYLVKHLNGKQYLALHRSGDIRGNYTDFIDITKSDILDDLSLIMATITITKDGKEYSSFNNSSFDTFDFEPIEELNLTSEDLEDLYWENA